MIINYLSELGAFTYYYLPYLHVLRLQTCLGRLNWKKILATPYPDCQKLLRNAGSIFFIVKFLFSLLSYFHYHTALRPAWKKTNLRKNLIFHTFCFKVYYCRFENLPISSSLYKINMLKIIHWSIFQVYGREICKKFV